MRVRYLKHPDTPHWRHEPMAVLGTDEHGLWLGANSATWLQKGDVPVPRTMHERGFFCTHPFVQLIVPDGWWTLIFNGAGRDFTHYIDIVTPAVQSDDTVTFVDLDLDVVRTSEGKVMLDDEDEFSRHRVELGYPSAWVESARTAAAGLAERLDRLDEPFGSVCAGWRDRLLATT